jgi:hypothetical protein
MNNNAQFFSLILHANLGSVGHAAKTGGAGLRFSMKTADI